MSCTDSRIRRTTAHALCLGLLTAMIGAAQPAVLLQENFSTPGTHLDYSKWTTPTGAASYFGRTQLANWTPGGGGQFVVAPDGAHLVLSTFNPTGFSLYGTQAQSLATFQPTANSVVEFSTRLQLTSLQPGLVFGLFLYGGPGNCTTNHDEIDIELVTNVLQGRSPLQVQLNRYANERAGSGQRCPGQSPQRFRSPRRSHLDHPLVSYSDRIPGRQRSSWHRHHSRPAGPHAGGRQRLGTGVDWLPAYSPALGR